jgi:hypothetical protein
MSTATLSRSPFSTLMPLEKPHFTSQIPAHLLQDATDRDKYILESLSVITQNNNWLVDETIRQSCKLETLEKTVGEVKTQTTLTNGRVTRLEDKNTANKESEDELKKILVVKNWIWKLLSSKLFWTVSTVTTILLVKSGFFSLLFQWLSSHMGIQ